MPRAEDRDGAKQMKLQHYAARNAGRVRICRLILEYEDLNMVVLIHQLAAMYRLVELERHPTLQRKIYCFGRPTSVPWVYDIIPVI